MKSLFYLLTFAAVTFCFSACALSASKTTNAEQINWAAKGLPPPADGVALTSLLQKLDELAELERAGTWIQGMALSESGIRENAGDYAGAVAAAYKELALAYGRGFIQKSDLENGLLNLLAVKGDESVTVAASSILAFLNEKWDEAGTGLMSLFNHLELDEPDGFGRWMILVCALEKDKSDKRAGAAYRSIRARYAQFPEYWYRGARVFSGIIAAEFAENCINSSPQGPFANECRLILASHTGLNPNDGLSIKTKLEIDSIIAQSVNSGNPQVLDSLFSLISLPDNPYTVYAVGIFCSLTSYPGFRDYFNLQAASAKGRLFERLSYICRS
ncbi:MAG: hypothetical protein FWD24_00985 [Treponema sp.]|nr:hypothetical protein [Treponema sp.]